MNIDRRHLLTIAMATSALTLTESSVVTGANPEKKIKAIAFDGFVIFDPRPITALVEEMVPGRGAEITAVWRGRQFEYTWLRTLAHSYVDFWQITREALIFTSDLLKLNLSTTAMDRLMNAFLQLKAWPDAVATLTALRSAGIRMAFLSDFSASMLDANIRSAGLEGYFENHLSTDSVKAYKPDPRSYQMAIDHFNLRRDEIAFTAFGGWDAAGAKQFGYSVYWCNRLQEPVERLGIAPDYVAGSTAELMTFVKTVPQSS